MRCAGFSALLVGLGWLFACGSQPEQPVFARQAGSEPSAGVEEPAEEPEPDAGVPGDPSEEEDPMEPFMDIECPPPPPAEGNLACDAFNEPSGCEEGFACFPTVIYPSGPCEVERFGTVCAPAGEGRQGQQCETQRCAANHVCVSTGRGTFCVQMCGFQEPGATRCPPGLLCQPIDIEGFGGCLGIGRTTLPHRAIW